MGAPVPVYLYEHVNVTEGVSRKSTMLLTNSVIWFDNKYSRLQLCASSFPPFPLEETGTFSNEVPNT